MNEKMLLEMVGAEEAFLAHVAEEVALVRVDSPVSFELVGPSEPLPAAFKVA